MKAWSPIALLVIACSTLGALESVEAQFSYRPAGELPDGSGTGRIDERVYAPEMLYPIRDAPSYANSQVYGVGGSRGSAGSTCDDRNYQYPWVDNYCERRTWDMPLCPAGQGHQGQDIRASSCEKNVHPVIAVVDGRISNIGSYSVYLTAPDGTRYDFLHMGAVAVTLGQQVSAGTILGYVSNEFGGTPTSIHLHFNIRQSIAGVGSVYVPPYTSLIRAYEELIGVGTDYRATFVSQTFPFASVGMTLTPGETYRGEIVLRNTGSATWIAGTTYLGTTEPRDVSSPLRGPDWFSEGRAATVESDVEPNAQGVFAFTIRAPDEPGEYRQYFNLVHEGTAWFGDRGGPPDNQLQIRVIVQDDSAPDSGSPTAGVMDSGMLGDGGSPVLDAGVIEPGVIDADSTSFDAGDSSADAMRQGASVRQGERQLRQGCGCRVGRGTAPIWASSGVVLLAFVGWRRRRS